MPWNFSVRFFSGLRIPRLGACVKSGDEIELICDGVDEKEALERLTAEIESGLGQ